MALFKWYEITTKTWIVSVLILAGIVLMDLRYGKKIVAMIQFA